MMSIWQNFNKGNKVRLARNFSVLLTFLFASHRKIFARKKLFALPVSWSCWPFFEMQPSLLCWGGSKRSRGEVKNRNPIVKCKTLFGDYKEKKLSKVNLSLAIFVVLDSGKGNSFIWFFFKPVFLLGFWFSVLGCYLSSFFSKSNA